ncbi:MAG: CRISPR-associated helicase/endonuclease Cas3 [Thermoprotei archaeon]|nr:MAG: CRISPR-associated helicase/endonuclease Cas3 [Thermoprotei archaeon]
MLPFSNLYSHPGRLLEDHLISVANLSELFCKDKQWPAQEILKAVTRIVGLSHDLGKATNFFQDYLHANKENKERHRDTPETHHSLFSAVCAYYLVKEWFVKNKKEAGFYPFFAFEAVKRHHGNLRDLMDEAIFDDGDKKLLTKQLRSINTANFAILAQYLFEAGLPTILTKEIISQWIDGLSRELRAYKRALRQNHGATDNYLLLNATYSILLDADKSDVVLKQPDVFKRETDSITDNLVDVYKTKNTFQNSPINILRESAYKEGIEKDIDLQKKLYSINIPTGLGKTLASFSFALKLRELIKNKTQGEFIPRIVYALPFLSIIEQNAGIFQDVFKASKATPYTSILLKHHHLSEVFYQRDRDEEFETDAAKILIEGWNSEIIVTTFVQLFYTLISNKNKSLRKFHKLNGSIIILDEIQSIPIKYWSLIKSVFQGLMDRLNVYVIFVTATKPLIFEKNDMVGLIESESYFSKMSRVTIEPLLDKDMSLRELYETFEIDNDKRYLFIFNTINAAKEFYGMVKNDYKDISFLSTHIVPKERLARIENIKKGKYKIVVTTQLVEAGVDIDFDVVLRDIAPLDSINQAAGRCNRNGNFTHGRVYVVSLINENNSRYASFIYDAVLLDITRRILDKYQRIDEAQFLELIEEYYAETSSKKSQDKSREILKAIEKLRYDSEDRETVSISDFRLIDEEYSKKDVFIEIDDVAAKVWSRYAKLERSKDLFERKRTFDEIKGDFYQYVISVPATTENFPAEVGYLYYVENAFLSDYYDRETGFVMKDDRSLVIW